MLRLSWQVDECELPRQQDGLHDVVADQLKVGVAEVVPNGRAVSHYSFSLLNFISNFSLTSSSPSLYIATLSYDMG